MRLTPELFRWLKNTPIYVRGRDTVVTANKSAKEVFFFISVIFLFSTLKIIFFFYRNIDINPLWSFVSTISIQKILFRSPIPSSIFLFHVLGDISLIIGNSFYCEVVSEFDIWFASLPLGLWLKYIASVESSNTIKLFLKIAVACCKVLVSFKIDQDWYAI